MTFFKLDLAQPARHVDVAPGGEIRFKGSFISTDGSTIDAATTSWPDAEHPGVDAGGFVDFEGGGFHLSSRDPTTHEVVAVATGAPAPLCQAAGVASPCVALRLGPLARTRLLTRDELRTSLRGDITIEHVSPPPPPAKAPLQEAAESPLALALLAALLATVAVSSVWLFRRRARLSPAGQLKLLVSRVQRKLRTADAALAATLNPVVKKALRAVEQKQIAPSSPQAARIREALDRVEMCLDQTASRTREARSREVADELLFEMQSALDAATETASL